MKFFVYDNAIGDVMLNDESILLIKEFKALLNDDRNKTKTDKTGKNRERAFREFKYIYLFFDWGSPYFLYSEQERNIESRADSELTDVEFEDPLFREACRKYDELQNSSLEIRLLRAAMDSVENLIFYLGHVDLTERDEVTGKPIFKSKDLIAEIKGCKDVISGLRELEKQVKSGAGEEAILRGGVEAGFYD